MSEAGHTPLRRGWTTGTCAAGAAKAAFVGALTGTCPDMVEVALPNGSRPLFAIACSERLPDGARAGIVKDAGDDPDVTHGALILATVRPAAAGTGVSFRAGLGIGTITRPGLPLPPGEPAINPVPRQMIRAAIAEAAREFGAPEDVIVEISIPAGEELAKRTLNGRLGIVGGLSILGTTGIVVPYSCAAWIDTIHRGIDVARAMGLDHVAGATGATSEAAVTQLHGLPEPALIDMGDFIGGMLKYLRAHPVKRVTVAGGFAKMTKLGQGLLDVHSKRGAVDFNWLAGQVESLTHDAALVERVRDANTANEVIDLVREAGLDLGAAVAEAAWKTAARPLAGSGIALDVTVFDRQGQLVAATPAREVH
jgi:cobalt-precorrin-5B (C1)-methyltransferase